MKNPAARFHLATATVLLAALSMALPLVAQTPLRVTIPGNAFTAEGNNVAVDDVAGGRRFRGKAFAAVKLRATVQVPPPASADPILQRLVVHFRASPSGPSLRLVELLNGAPPLKLSTDVGGDRTASEITQPASAANAWALDRSPVRVGPQSVVRLEVQFPGGFEGGGNSGEFVLTGVVVDYPRKAVLLPSTAVSTGTDKKPASIPATLPTTTTATTTTGRGRGQLIEPSDSVATSAVLPVASVSRGVIYALANNNELLWYRHSGYVDGSATWATPQGKTVGTGWDFKQVFSGGDGVIYAITSGGDLMWYRHDGRGDGSFTWAAQAGKKIGSGWNFEHVFYGGGGVIYAITTGGDLLWYRHDGRNDGSATWAAPEGKQVGTGWKFKHVFSGGDGVIYVVTASNDLVWYRHDGRTDGTFRWAASEGKTVGTGWDVRQVFSGGDGVIYAVLPNGDLMWNRHDGRADGTFKWAAPQGKKVGSGWNFKAVF